MPRSAEAIAKKGQAELFLHYAKPGFTIFRDLSKAIDFVDIRARLADWQSIQDIKVTPANRAVPLSLGAVIVVALNDHISRNENLGGFLRHGDQTDTDSSNVIVYARCGWKPADRKLYMNLTPMERMRASSIWAGWAKTGPLVRCLRICTPPPRRHEKDTSRTTYKFDFTIPRNSPAQYQDKTMLLLLIDKKIIVVTMQEILQGQGVRQGGDHMGYQARQTGRGPWYTQAFPPRAPQGDHCTNCKNTVPGRKEGWSRSGKFSGIRCNACRQTWYSKTPGERPAPIHSEYTFWFAPGDPDCERWAAGKYLGSNNVSLQDSLLLKLEENDGFAIGGGRVDHSIEYREAVRQLKG